MQKRLSSMQSPVLDAVSVPGLSGYAAHGVQEYILDNGDFMHFHALIEIGVCVSGEGTCTVDGVDYAYHAGSAQFILPFQPHLSISSGQRLSHWKWIFIDPRELEISIRDSGSYDYLSLINGGIGISGVFDDERFPEIAAAIHSFIDELSSTAASDKREMSLLLLRSLMLKLGRASAGYPKYSVPISCLDERLLNTLASIEESIANGIQPHISALAAESGYSESRFREYFRKAVGLSPKGYILNLAVRRAQSLLINTALSVEDISKQVGFSDVSGLYRSFVSLRGFTPLEYRRRWRG